MMRVNFTSLVRDDENVYHYQGKPFTGVGYLLRSDGTLEFEQSMTFGIPDGPQRGWHATGQLRSETNYKLGWAHGPNRRWYPDGKLKLEEVFELGECTERRRWNEAGELVEDFKIDPASPAYRRLQDNRRTEDGRVKWVCEKYGKVAT